MTIASKMNTRSTLAMLGFLMAVFAFAMGSVSAAELNVSKTSNDGYSDISSAIDDSNNNDVVTIYDGTYSGEKNTNIVISKNITIQSSSYAKKSSGKTIIDGSGQQNSIFHINPDVTVNIYGITFKNYMYNNGAIGNYGTLIIGNSEFVGNMVGILSKGQVDISNSNFTNNLGTALDIDSEGSVVKSSNFVSNARALIVAGSNNNINYNRITDNSMDIINYGTYTNINFNWWGNNEGNINSVSSTGYVNLIKLYWFVLKLSSDNKSSLKTAEANYVGGDLALLKYNLDTNEPVPTDYDLNFDSSLLPVFQVSLTAPNGTKISWDSNKEYIYRLTGFKGNVSYFKLSADKEAFNLKINFLGGIIPSIQPTGCAPVDTIEKTKTNNKRFVPAAGSPDDVDYSDDSNDSNGSNYQTKGTKSGDMSQGKYPNEAANTESGNTANASMKKTAMPLIAMFLSIFAIATVFIRKN